MNIAVYYHVRLFGGEPAIDPSFSIPLMMEQMATMQSCGLTDAATEIVVPINGNSENQVAVRGIAPKKAQFIDHGAACKSLLRTMNCLREWCIAHPDWLVCFWHIKGVTHPGDVFYNTWRLCMEHWVILHWRDCVRDVSAGYDTVGAHWLTKEQYGSCVTHPFWGGQFFWAKASFLATLPKLPDEPTCRQDWFLSENWIGMGRRPRIKDYAPHWPNMKPCSESLGVP